MNQSIQSTDSCERDSESGHFQKWVSKLAKFIRNGSHVIEIRNNNGVHLGFLSQSTSDIDVVYLEEFLVGTLTGKRNYSPDVLSVIAASLALRYKYSGLRGKSTSILVESYISILITSSHNVYDLVLCSGLLGGGMLHLVDGSLQQVHPLHSK